MIDVPSQAEQASPSPRTRHALALFYKQFCYDGRFVRLDPLNTGGVCHLLQRRLGVSTIIQIGVQEALLVREQIVPWSETSKAPSTLVLETGCAPSVPLGASGESGQVDLLLYAFALTGRGLLIYLLDAANVQQWLAVLLARLPRPVSCVIGAPSAERSIGHLVEISQLAREVGVRCFLVTTDEQIHEVSPEGPLFPSSEPRWRSQTHHKEAKYGSLTQL